MRNHRSAVILLDNKLALAERSRFISYTVLVLESASGGLTAAVTLVGRALPTSASAAWIGTVAFACLLFAAWGWLFAVLIRWRAGATWPRALYLAALCHLPLLLGLGVIRALYSSDMANHVYAASVYGDVVFRPMVLSSLIVAPGALQATVAALLGRRQLAIYLPVAAPVLVALGLRFWSLGWQLPYLFHNDERGYLSTAMIMWAHGDPNPRRFVNPSVMFYADTALFALLGGSRSEIFRIFAEAFGRQFWDPKGIYLVALASRGFVALLGAGTVAAVYLAARELFGRRAGLFASWFMAVSFLHVRNSHYGTNDVAAISLATMSFLFAARLYRTGRWSDYLLAGILGGLATSTKYNAGMFILPLLVAHLARQVRSELTSLPMSRRIIPLLASYFASGVAFVLATPYSVLDWGSFARDFRAQYGYGASPWATQDALPTWWMHLAGLVHGYGLLPLLLSTIGALWAIRHAPLRLGLVAAFPAGYYAFMSGQQLYFARFTIPLIPFVAILSGCGLAWLENRTKSLRFGALLASALLVVALSQSLALSVQSNLVIGKEDTRVLADRWVSANVPERGLILLDDFSDLRPSQPWPSRQDIRVQMYDPTKDPAPWKQLSERPVYVVTSSFGYELVHRRFASTVRASDPYKPLRDEGRLVASFDGARGGEPVDYSIDDTYTPFWHVLDYERSGPAVYVFRFGSDR